MKGGLMNKTNQRKKNERKRHTGTRLAAGALSAMLLATAFITPIEAMANTDSSPQAVRYIEGRSTALSAENERAAKVNYNLPGIPSRNVSHYHLSTVRYNGRVLSYKSPLINGINYLPLGYISELIASAAVNVTASGTATVSAAGLYLSATHGGFVTYANDRPLFSFSPTIYATNGEIYVPASVIQRAFGLKIDVDGTIDLSGTYKPLKRASEFYREDEVYWLSKIISAESSGESLLGQIAVGDVILNRVKSPSFPNTIYSVIFDKKYGVQFSPTADGRIYASPTYTATLAAKICLEGISLSDEAMYFLNPRAASSNWIVKNRYYVYTIGNHDFYE